ncbi:MAG: hypothetical protein M3Q65_19940 [Chloroflexota bacterium]|nr:hypothetical protein [Chloroflexota bacterium]
MRKIHRFLPALLLIVLLGLALAACGNSVRTEARNRGRIVFTSEVLPQRVEVVADPNGALRWTQERYEAQAGGATFLVRNPSIVIHQFAVEGTSAEGRTISAQSPNFDGQTEHTFTLTTLPPGEYEVVCNYDGHREGGMVSRLIVNPAAGGGNQEVAVVVVAR